MESKEEGGKFHFLIKRPDNRQFYIRSLHILVFKLGGGLNGAEKVSHYRHQGFVGLGISPFILA